MVNFSLRKEGAHWVVFQDKLSLLKDEDFGWASDYLLYRSSQECIVLRRPVSVSVYYENGAIILSGWIPEKAALYHHYLAEDQREQMGVLTKDEH